MCPAVVLVLGSGAREHAICTFLHKSPYVSSVLFAPGNGGFDQKRCRDVNIDDFEAVVALCVREAVSLVVVGPEKPLANGIVDFLHTHNIMCFGPSAKGATIESDKAYAKRLMDKLSIPTARWHCCNSVLEARRCVQREFAGRSCVVKMNGLAGGKGVFVCSGEVEALEAVEQIARTRPVTMSAPILVEECLPGCYEMSLMVFTDGQRMFVCPPAQDYKRLHQGDVGPNTGGMGVCAGWKLNTCVSEHRWTEIAYDCIQPILDWMCKREIHYCGVLYAGLMFLRDGSYRVLEYNCRLGDPETQSVLPLLDCDVYDLMVACTNRKDRRLAAILANQTRPGSSSSSSSSRLDRACVCVVLTSHDYARSTSQTSTSSTPCATVPLTQLPIVDFLSDDDCVFLFHSATTAQPSAPVERPDAMDTSAMRGQGVGVRVHARSGRVLSVVCVSETYKRARSIVMRICSQCVLFEGKHFRADVGTRAVMSEILWRGSGASYAQAGVSVVAGDNFVSAIRDTMASAKQSTDAIGGFAGLFDFTDHLRPAVINGESDTRSKMDHDGYEQHGRRYIVASTDGVGTKSKLVLDLNSDTRHLGVDLVAMCVNDVICMGAHPLLFLDYLAAASLRDSRDNLLGVVAGMSEACSAINCRVLGGETAEMTADIYRPNAFDLVGFCVGETSDTLRLPRFDCQREGDLVVALPSSGLHSNGFSLVRHVIAQTFRSVEDGEDRRCSLVSDHPSVCGQRHASLGECLIQPTAVYVNPTRELIRRRLVLAMSHITGGGIVANLSRVIAPTLRARLDSRTWMLANKDGDDAFVDACYCSLSAIAWLAYHGNINCAELLNTFNMGVGLLLVVAKDNKDEVFEILRANKQICKVVGFLENRGSNPEKMLSPVTVLNLHECVCEWMLSVNTQSLVGHHISADDRLPVGILVSGTGSNMQSLIEHSLRIGSKYRVVIVICDRASGQARARAENLNVLYREVDYKQFANREQFEQQLVFLLQEHGAKFVCCAGFMRILTSFFINRWRDRLLNIHPSLLPAFPGIHAVRQALGAGVCVTGSTVHYILEQLDAGPIVAQETVRVRADDTECSLHERIKQVERVMYPRALEEVASRLV